MASFITNGLYGFYFFIIITFIYFAIKYVVGDNLVITLIYYLALIFGQFGINLSTTNSVCGHYQTTTAIIVTAVPWIFIFGLLMVLLKILPGWLTPFSNTIGYLIAKFAGIGKVFNELLVSPENNPDKKLINDIYNDNSLLINEITTKNFNNFWKRMIESNIFKQLTNGNEDSKIGQYRNQLEKLVKLKELVAEMTWYLLSGILISSITYNYILNSDCDKSENIIDLQNEYLQTTKDFMPSNQDASERVYASTE